MLKVRGEVNLSEIRTKRRCEIIMRIRREIGNQTTTREVNNWIKTQSKITWEP